MELMGSSFGCCCCLLELNGIWAVSRRLSLLSLQPPLFRLLTLHRLFLLLLEMASNSPLNLIYDMLISK